MPEPRAESVEPARIDCGDDDQLELDVSEPPATDLGSTESALMEPYKAPPMNDARREALFRDPRVKVYRRRGPLVPYEPKIRLVGKVDLLKLIGRDSKDGLREFG